MSNACVPLGQIVLFALEWKDKPGHCVKTRPSDCNRIV